MRNRFNLNESEKNRIRNLHRSVLLEEREQGMVEPTLIRGGGGPPGGPIVPPNPAGGGPQSTIPGGNSGVKTFDDGGSGDIKGYSCIDDPNNPPTHTKCVAYGSPEYVSYYGTQTPQYPTIQDCNTTGPCKGSVHGGDHPCPPTDQNSPFHTNYPEFCYRNGSGQLEYCSNCSGCNGYYAGNPDCACCP